tara:strand:- start:885 stop:1322 length:438 start_codon:yes stop_codon:yes gene_type:complete
MPNDYQDAINKRNQQTTSNSSTDASLSEWAKEGWGFIKRGINVVSDKVGDQLEKVAPSDPELRVQKEVVDKVNRDELMQKAGHAGRALGNRISSLGGAGISAGTAFLKGALGAVSNEAKARLDEIDGVNNPSKSDPESDNNNPVG